MNMERLGAILSETTRMLQKDESVTSEFERVDCHYCAVAVCKQKAPQLKDELAVILQDYPIPSRLKLGPSYIELAGTLFEGDNEMAFRLMALGKVLGFWDIITPGKLGISGVDADRLAYAGTVMIEDCKV